MTRFSRPVIISSTAADWPARPIMRRTAIGSRTTSCPLTTSVPRVGREERRHHADEGGLAGAVGPEDGDGLPGRQGEGQVGEGLHLPEFLGEAVGLYERVHARLLSRGV